MIIIYSNAYNAEKTLPQAINSVINQTHRDFIYYICDNASTDNTWNIMQKYAERDKKIHLLRNEQNTGLTGFDGWNTTKIIQYMIKEYSDDDCFCTLDADDEYKPDFLEKMLDFMEENNLDVAACGSDFINAQTNQLQSRRLLESDLILESPECFDEKYTQYHQFMRTVWCKVYRGSLLKQFDYENYDKSIGFGGSYGSDTLFCMRAFHHAKRVGILAESLHKYYISPKSVSYKFDNKRIISDQILHDETTKFLIEKAGYVSPLNKEFLFFVYFNAINDTLNVLLNAKISLAEKLAGFKDIFTSSQTRELSDFVFTIYQQANNEKETLFNGVVNWVITKEEIRSDEGLETASDIFAAAKTLPKKFDGWSAAEIFVLLMKTLEKSKSSEFNKILDSQIIAVAHQQQLLNCLNADLLVFFSDIAVEVLCENFTAALEIIFSYIEEEREIPEGSGIPLITLGLNLSAKLERMNDFIFLKKLHISLLIDSGQKDTAAAELAEWLEIMPDDEDFIALGGRISE